MATSCETPIDETRTRQETRRVLLDGLRRNLNTGLIPHRPTPRQAQFLLLPDDDALYGGAAGGGKSDALLMGGLQFADVPEYSAVILRRTFSDLSKPGAIMDRAHDWLGSSGAKWSGDTHAWRFPSLTSQRGATLAFSYLDHQKDVYKHQSAEYHYIGIDEMTQIPMPWLRYIRSRLRRLAGSTIPLRFRGATNPGGISHQGVYAHYGIDGRPGRPFIPALLEDNPYLDTREYDKQLREQDPIVYEQLRRGRWVVDPRNRIYDMAYWDGNNRFVPGITQYNSSVARWQFWDTAMKDEEHNALTSCVTFELRPDYRVCVTNEWHDHVKGVDAADVIWKRASVSNGDGKLRGVVIEDQSSGTIAIQALQARGDWIGDLVVPFDPAPFGDKLFERPTRAALWCSRDCVLLPHPGPESPWLFDFESGLEMFPDIEFFDPYDAFHMGCIYLEHYLVEGWRARNPNPEDYE